MSNVRGSDPQLLSIEAIIQKSQQKSKMLNNIPIDFKKLFIQQIVKRVHLKQEPKRSTIVYEGYKNKLEPCQASKQKKIVPSFASHPNVNNKSSTKRIFRSNSMQPIISARAQGDSTKIKRQQRQSLAEIVIKKQLVQSIDENESIMNPLKDGKNKNQLRQTWQSESFFPAGAARLGKMQIHNNRIDICQRTDTLQSHPKSEGKRADDVKIDIKFQQQQLKRKNSDQLTKFHQTFSKTQTIFPKSISPKKKSSLQKIPNFVIEAVVHESEKISKKCWEQKNFEFELNEDKNEKIREIKAPMSLTNLKKKVSFYKARRRSEESLEELFEPKINLIKLLTKQKVPLQIKTHKQIKTSDGLGRKLQKGKRKHMQAEEEVRGWDLRHEDEF